MRRHPRITIILFCSAVFLSISASCSSPFVWNADIKSFLEGVEYSALYDGNGNTGGTAPVDPSTYPPNAEVTVQGRGTLVRAGCDFLGWNTEADGSGDSYGEGGTLIMGTEDVTLYAQWQLTMLSAPQNLSVTDNTTFLRIEWDSVSNADGYHLECAKDINGSPSTYSTIATVTGTFYDHNEAPSSATGWYRVQAYSEVGLVSPYSADVSGEKTGTVLFEEDWEDGVWNDTWVDDRTTGDTVECSTAHYVAPGTWSLRIRDNGDNWAYYDGLHYEFPVPITPNYIRFSVRKNWDQACAPWINLADDTPMNGYDGSIWYRWNDDGNMSVTGGGNVWAGHDTFHHVEFRNIDFSSQTFDFYVDDVLITADVPFYQTVPSFTRLYISVGWYAQDAFIDKIEVRE